MKPSIYEQNVAFIRELLPEKQWAAEMWLADCDRLNLRFRILEAFRPADRQYKLWASHFIHGGPWRTDCDGYKVLSQHQLRLAVDIQPINCSHVAIQMVAQRYGITHPWPVADPPHYSLDKAVSKPTPNIPKSTAAAERRLERELQEAKEPRKSRLAARKEGLKRVK